MKYAVGDRVQVNEEATKFIKEYIGKRGTVERVYGCDSTYPYKVRFGGEDNDIFRESELSPVEMGIREGVVLVNDGGIYLSDDGEFIDWEPLRILAEYHGKRIKLTWEVLK